MPSTKIAADFLNALDSLPDCDLFLVNVEVSRAASKRYMMTERWRQNYAAGKQAARPLVSREAVSPLSETAA